MQTVEFNQFTVEVYSDELYSLNSTDNVNVYNHAYYSNLLMNPEKVHSKSQYGIRIKDGENIIGSAIIIAKGGCTSPHEKSIVVDNNNLVLIIGDSIFSLSIPDLKLNWKTENEDCVTCFELYKLANGYIVHGELSIFKVDLSGEIAWDFFGKDIFTTPEGTAEFQACEDYVIAEDWDHNIYKIDMMGKSIPNMRMAKRMQSVQDKEPDNTGQDQ